MSGSPLPASMFLMSSIRFDTLCESVACDICQTDKR